MDEIDRIMRALARHSKKGETPNRVGKDVPNRTDKNIPNRAPVTPTEGMGGYGGKGDAARKAYIEKQEKGEG